MPAKTAMQLAKMLKKVGGKGGGRSSSSVRTLKKKAQKFQAGKKFKGPANANTSKKTPRKNKSKRKK